MITETEKKTLDWLVEALWETYFEDPATKSMRDYLKDKETYEKQKTRPHKNNRTRRA